MKDEQLNAGMLDVLSRLAENWRRRVTTIHAGIRGAVRQIIAPKVSWFGSSPE